MPVHELGERPTESKTEVPDNWRPLGALIRQAVAEAERKREGGQ